MKTTITTLLILTLRVTTLFSQNLYPFGDEYPLGLYAIYSDYQEAENSYFNVSHTYQEAPVSNAYFQNSQQFGMSSMARLSFTSMDGEKYPKPNAEIISEINQQIVNDNMAWWDISEELRYWISNEQQILEDYTQLTRQTDIQQRPNFMYIPGHYDVPTIAEYVEFLDIIPASCYTNHQGLEHSYVRWSIERTKEAIITEGYTLGQDYLNGEKTVMAILELFEDTGNLTPEGTTYDFWLSAALDVKGILTYAHFYSNSSSSLTESWNALKNANIIFKENNFGEVLLNGISQTTDYTITSGPETAVLSLASSLSQPTQFE